MGGTRRLPPLVPPPSSSSSLSTGRLFPPPPSSPPTCSSLRDQGSPPPPFGRRAGGSRINPPSHSDFPPSPPPPPPGSPRLDFAPGRAGGGVPAAPCPSTPSESGPGRGRGRGKGAGRRCSNLFPSPGGGRGYGSCVRVCAPTGPPTPPPLAGRVGAALKGLRAGLGRLGIGGRGGGWVWAGARSAVGSVTCVPHTLWLLKAPGPLGLGGSRSLPSPEEGAEGPRQPRLVFAPCYGPSPGGTGWAAPPSQSWGRAVCGFSGWGKGREPLLASRWVHGSICLLAGRCAPLHPILYPGPTLLCRGCFPLPVFFPALAPPRAAWSGGGGGAPQEAGVFFLYHCSSLPTPIVLLKKVWAVKVNLRGAREFCTPRPPPHAQVSTVCLGDSLPRLCGIQVCLLGPRHPSPSCLLPLLHPVWQCPQFFCQLLCLCLTVPPVPRRSCIPRLSWCRPGGSLF